MKLSVAIAAQDAPDTAFVVWRGIEDSIKKAAGLGFHGVELALKDAAEICPQELDTWLSRSGIEVSCISTGQVFAVSNLYFTHPDPDVRENTFQAFRGLVELAADHGQLINVGRARGSYREKQSRAETERLFIEMAQRICDYGEPKGVTLMIEPVNRYEINFINSVEEGAELLRRVDRPNIGLMPDVFHMNIEDRQIGQTLIDHADLVRYVHLADSNRNAPGQAHLDFDDVFGALARSGFDGWVSIEILPLPDPDTAARQAAEFILPRIEKYRPLVPA